MLERVDPDARILTLAGDEHVRQRRAPFHDQGRRGALNDAEKLGAIAVGAVGEPGVDGEEVGKVGGYRGGNGGEVCGLGGGRETLVILEDIADNTALSAGGQRQGRVRIAGEGGGIGKGGCCGEDEGVGHFVVDMVDYGAMVKMMRASMKASCSCEMFNGTKSVPQ